MQKSEKEPLLPHFQQFLLERRLAAENHVPFYAVWVSKYLSFSNRQTCAKPQELLFDMFINFLRGKPSITDWQIRQAEVAVRLYLDHFLSKQGVSAAQSTPSAQLDADVGNAAVLAAMHEALRVKHYSYRTEKTYLAWSERFGEYLSVTSGKCLSDGDSTDVRDFMTHLATRQGVASSTQNQAFNAVLFLMRNVLNRNLEELGTAVRAKRGSKLPVVLSVEEVGKVFSHLEGPELLMAHLLYGAGLRLMELARLRVQDIDFQMNCVMVRDGKGAKDRTTLLPDAVKDPLRLHLKNVKALHEQDIAAGHGEVHMPESLDRKYSNAGRDWGWQYVFPSGRLSVDPRSGKVRRHHVSEKGIQAAVYAAVRRAGIVKHATVHTLRHSFATHMLMGGVNIREIQDLLGHKSVETTMIYTHVLRGMTNAPMSPLDSLLAGGGSHVKGVTDEPA